MCTGRVASISLFLVVVASGANAQSAPGAGPERPAQIDLAPSGAASIQASFPRLASFPLQVDQTSNGRVAGLIRDVDAFQPGSMRARGSGALIGAALGSMLGATVAYASCQGGIGSCPGGFYFGAAAGALPGAAIGALIGHTLTRGSVALERGGTSSSAR